MEFLLFQNLRVNFSVLFIRYRVVGRFVPIFHVEYGDG